MVILILQQQLIQTPAATNTNRAYNKREMKKIYFLNNIYFNTPMFVQIIFIKWKSAFLMLTYNTKKTQTH